MIESITYLSDWWRWWSNPLVNMHTSKQDMLPYAKAQLEAPDFLLFLELRSVLSLADKPDRQLEEHPEIRSLALAMPHEVDAIGLKTAVLGLDATILQTNAQQWAKLYGIDSPDEVRNVIQLWNQVPYKLKPWQESLMLNINAQGAEELNLEQRSTLVLGAYLRSFYPEFYKRWVLTIPYLLSLKLDTIDLFPEDCGAQLNEWLRPALNKVHQNVLERYPSEQIDMPFDNDPLEQEAIDKLAILEDFDNA